MSSNVLPNRRRATGTRISRPRRSVGRKLPTSFHRLMEERPAETKAALKKFFGSRVN